MDSCLELYYKILMFVFMSIMKIFKVVYMREKWQLFKKYSNSNPILVFLWKCLIYMLNLIISCVHLRRYLWSSLLTNENMCSACVHRFFFPENIKNKNKSNRSRENISNKICLEQSLKTYSAHFFVFWRIFILKFLNLIRFSDYSWICSIKRLSLIIMMQKMCCIIHESRRKWKKAFSWKHMQFAACRLSHTNGINGSFGNKERSLNWPFIKNSILISPLLSLLYSTLFKFIQKKVYF